MKQSSDHLMWNRCTNCYSNAEKNGVKTGLRAINLKENVYCLRLGIWCASVKITTAEGRKIIVKWNSTHTHTYTHYTGIFFIFHLTAFFYLLLLYVNGCIFRSRNDDQFEEQCTEKLYFATIHLHFMTAFALQMHDDSNMFSRYFVVHPILYVQKNGQNKKKKCEYRDQASFPYVYKILNQNDHIASLALNITLFMWH